MPKTPWRADTGTGTALPAVPPLPSSPSPPCPQDQTVPSPRSAYPADMPAAMAVTLPRADTGTAVSPGPNGSVAAQRVPGVGAGGDGGDVRQVGHGHRGGAAGTY